MRNLEPHQQQHVQEHEYSRGHQDRGYAKQVQRWSRREGGRVRIVLIPIQASLLLTDMLALISRVGVGSTVDSHVTEILLAYPVGPRVASSKRNTQKVSDVIKSYLY